MGLRLDLQQILLDVMDGNNVYFQPPSSVKLVYPCIVYTKDKQDTKFADNNPYRHVKKYEVTVIDRNPDSIFPDKVANLPMCLHNRNFASNDLNHDVFTLFF